MANGAVIAIVVIIIVLLLVGLGVGAYYLLRKKGNTGGTGGTGGTGTNPPPNTVGNPIGLTGPNNSTNIPPVNFTPPFIPGPTGPTCPNGPGGVAPEGCSACSTPGIFLCPGNVMSAGSGGRYTQNSQVSCFRSPQYDPPTPPITIAGKGYFFREANNSCPA